MNNLKQKHKDYLIKNEIKDLTDLVNYVEILRNTSNLQGEDRQMLFDFAFLITNEQLSLKSFFAENFRQELYNQLGIINDNVNVKSSDSCFTKTSDIIDEINKMGCSPTPSKEFYSAFKQTTSSPTFMDEVLEQANKEKWNPLDELHKRAAREMFNTIKDEDGQFNSTRHKSKEGETHTEVPSFEVNYTPTTGYKNTEKFVLIELNKLPEYKETDDKGLLNDYVTKIIGNNPPFRTVEGTERQGEFATMEEIFSKAGKKESQTVKKAPIFTFCKQMKNAVEKLALRSLYGHEKYEKGDDWSNFARVPNADFEYSNSQFRHALEIGGEETEEEHLTASAWNAISRLEIYLRNKVK